MNYETEFEVVDLILDSKFETRGIDAFILSILKMERQIRRIFTYLVFQYQGFSNSDIDNLIITLSSNRNIYFKHFIIGIDNIYTKPIKEIYGPDYQSSFSSIEEVLKIRNKIFHGQLTGKNLSREDLVDKVTSIRFWCSKVADSFNLEIGYDGFARDSYQKSTNPYIFSQIQWPFDGIKKYSDFIERLSKSKSLR